MRYWMKRLWCRITGGHEFVERRETRYLMLFDDESSARVPIDVVSKFCTRCS
jgi:hypothetical protein